ncbi:MAG: glycosyltransferase family 39 protein [Oligoflexia bacterium]|nr:glycosyltransferase family 39 protein [Oligoflexia bacterium]
MNRRYSFLASIMVAFTLSLFLTIYRVYIRDAYWIEMIPFLLLLPMLFFLGKGILRYLRINIGVVLLLSFILRVVWMLSFDTYPTMDSHQYYSEGLKIAAGGYWMNPANTPYWPIGYKAFLGALTWCFGEHLWLAKIVNILLQLLSCYLLYLITLLMFPSSKSSETTVKLAKFALCLYAFYPNSIFYSGAVWTEPLFTMLLLLSFWMLMRVPAANKHHFKSYLFAGVFFALASLVRPIAPVFPLVFFALKLLLERKIKIVVVAKQLLLLYAAFLLTLSPWAIRNYLLYNKIILTASNGPLVLFINFVLDNDESKLTKLMKPQGPVDESNMSSYLASYMLEHPFKTLKTMGKNVYRLYANDFDGIEITSESRLPQTIEEHTFQEVLQHIHPQIHLVDPKAFYTLKSEDGKYHLKPLETIPELTRIHLAQTIRYSFAYPYRETEVGVLRLMKALNSLFYYFVIIVFALSLIRTLRTLHSNTLLGLGIILLTTMIHASSVGGARYHFPIMPWIFAYVAYFLHTRSVEWQRKF